jgi:hypothetical protein
MRRTDTIIDIAAACIIGIACIAGLVRGRGTPYIVGLVILGFAVEAWYVRLLVRKLRRRPPATEDEQSPPPTV